MGRISRRGMDGVMKTGTRSNGPASLKVSYSQMVPASSRGLVREVSSVLCEPEYRKDGHASALLKEVMREADASRVTLMVMVKPYDAGGMDGAQLSGWYHRLGFVEIQAAPCVMARSPKRVQ
jgi:GNAT superfamily N-acetyltransferase